MELAREEKWGGGMLGRLGGRDGSRDESGTSDMAMAGWAAQMMPELDGVGPAAVIDIGDGFRTVTPLMVTSVGELISRMGAPVAVVRPGGATGGGAGGRGCDRGWMVARRGGCCVGGAGAGYLAFLRRGGGTGAMLAGTTGLLLFLLMKEGSLSLKETLDSGQVSFSSFSSLHSPRTPCPLGSLKRGIRGIEGMDGMEGMDGLGSRVGMAGKDGREGNSRPLSSMNWST